MAKALPISIMEIHVFRTTPNGKERVPDHPLERILNKKPNSYTTRNAWFGSSVYQYDYWGNHYARIYGLGDDIELELLDPSKVTPELVREGDGRPAIRYKISDGDKKDILQAHEVIHVKGFGESSIEGDSLAKRGGEDFGWDLELREYGRAFFANGAKPANVIEQDIQMAQLTPQQLEDLKTSFNEHQGVKAGGTDVLMPGWKLTNAAHANDQNQYIESRTHAIQNASRLLNVPLHKLKELSRGTYNNLEVVEQSFAKDSLQPITESIEAEYGDKLFTAEEKAEGLFIEFDYSKLLKFDPKSRAEYLQTAISSGWYTQNEARKEEGKNPYEGVGDDPMVNGGMVKLADLGKTGETNE